MKNKLLILVSLTIMTTAAKAQVKDFSEGKTYLNTDAPIEQRINDALSRMTLHEKVQMLHAQSKFTSAGVPRLGIRQLNMDDGPHGVREELEWNTWNVANWTNDSIVAFPSLTCLAATWNTDLSRLYGHSISEEFAFRGKDILLGPGVNIARTPMNGRAFEYMGEDPMLAAEIVVPYIQAAQRNGVACCLKHFVLNDQETDRFGVNVNVSERALREIYLFPFEKAVKKADVWTIMGSYNYWQNVHCTQYDQLINGILKGEWGFKGALISDWGGTTDTWQAATGGLDIEMGTFTDGKVQEAQFDYNDYYLADKFENLLKAGRIPMSVVDDKVRRVLRTIFLTAMNPNKVIGAQCNETHYDACLQIGEEGIVLLKNEPATKQKAAKKKEVVTPMLPLNLSLYNNILVVGENATRSLTKGGGSSELKTLYDVSPLEALQGVVKQMSPATNIDYAQGYYSGRAIYDKVDKVDPAQNAQLKAEAIEKARQADLIIFIGGLNKNHRQDCENGDRESYDLPFAQNELISELSAIQKNIVVITFGGNAYATPWLQQVPALLHCWYLGSKAGDALASVLVGKTNPSGKLPVTFAQKYEDYPYVKYGQEAYPGIKGVKVEPNSAGETPRSQVYYREGVFVGYRGFEAFKVKPQFPFGYGLSYTSFEYGKPTVKDGGDSISVSVSIANTGQCAGKEIAQLYVAAPKAGKEGNPVKELKAFAKTRLLQPGESQTVSLTFARQDLASWNETLHGWLTAPGKYSLLVGASSADIRGTAYMSLP